MRTLVMGDIHGQYKAMRIALERAGYDPQYDRLIVLGDECDGGPDTYKVIDYLCEKPNVIKILGNHDCVAEGTEILTSSGWCKIEDYEFNDTVAQYDINTKEITFDNPEEFVINTPQECICIEGYDTKQIVSELHEVLVDGIKIRAKDLIDKDIKSKSIPNYGYMSQNVGIDLSDDEIRLLTWVIMDGSFGCKDRKSCKVTFGLSKERKILSLTNLLDRMQIKYTKRLRAKNNLSILQPYTITISRAQSRHIYDLLYGRKEIPSIWSFMSKNQVNVFLETVLITDGCKSDGKIRWRSINKNNVNIMQEAFIKNGYSSTIKSYINGGKFKNQKLMYECNIYMTGRYKHNVSITKVGKIRTYCFKMPLGTIVTRRDGKCAITGNCWFMNYIRTSVELPIWISQGGYATLWSYECENRGSVPIRHAEYLHKAIPYYIDSKNRIYVHGGFLPHVPINEQDIDDILWDRQLISYAMNNTIDEFSHVYVGHTTTVYYNSFKPLTFNNLTMMDTGAGWPGGYLSIMDVDTKEVWQSDVIT